VSHTLREGRRERERERYFSLVVVQKKYGDFLLSGRREEKRSDFFFSTAAGE
jgi:hypothetical protein